MKTLTKILLGGMIVGVITGGVGKIVDNKIVSYIGAGAIIAGSCGFIIASNPDNNYRQRKKKDSDNTNYPSLN